MTRKTSVEIEEELLVAVRQLLGTSSIKDTIDRAFRELLKIEARREEIQALSEMDGLDLADASVMSGAWRS